MSSGIVCKVWNIQGSTQAKGAKEQLNDSVGYILNDEKTENKIQIEPLDQLMRECKYVENDIKTFEGAFVGGHNIVSTNEKDAVREMMDVKEFFGKKNGRAALHLLISLPEEESDIKNAPKLMELCRSVLSEVFPNNQAIFAVHTNTENLHIHAIINSVGLDGKKIHQNDKFMRDVLHPCVNKFATIYGFSENVKWKNESNNFSFPEQKIFLRNAIDRAIENSDSFESFIHNLEAMDIRCNTGKYISLQHSSMGKAIRTQHLGANYTRDCIVERIRTRRDSFTAPEVGTYVAGRPTENVFTPYTQKMKRYKDMSPTQKNHVIHQLRLGRNPWRENSLLNWQLNNIANELNSASRIDNYISFYSNDGSVQGALDGIIEAKKNIAHEKKMVAYAKKKYKPIIDIYSEMKAIERRAYLYEHQNAEEFRVEYELYRELTRRLKEGYNKEVTEVATFLQECDERLLYAHAQLNELSLEYRELKQYGTAHRLIQNKNETLTDLLGFYSNKADEKQGIFEADAFYISSSTSDLVIRVIKNPTIDSKGNVIEEYNLAVMTKQGDIISEVSSTETTYFSKEIAELQKRYNLVRCRKFNDFQRAKEFASNDNPSVPSELDIQKNMEKVKNFSFAQAINHIWENHETNVVINSSDPSLIALSSKEDNQLKIIIFDENKKPIETILIPLVKDKNNDGYEQLMKIQNKYGFSDHVLEFDNIESAHSYIEENKTNAALDARSKKGAENR